MTYWSMFAPFSGSVPRIEPNIIPRPFFYPNPPIISAQSFPGNAIYAGTLRMSLRTLSPPDHSVCTYRIVSREELERILPPETELDRIQSGVLPDGRVYAPSDITLGEYLLFPSIMSYVLYYFSRRNHYRENYICSLVNPYYAAEPERVNVPLPMLIAGVTVKNEGNFMLYFVGRDSRGYLARIDGYPRTNPTGNRFSRYNRDTWGGFEYNTSESRAGLGEASSAHQGPPIFGGQGHSITMGTSLVNYANAIRGSQALNWPINAMAGMDLGQQILLQAPPFSNFLTNHLATFTNPLLFQAPHCACMCNLPSLPMIIPTPAPCGCLQPSKANLDVGVLTAGPVAPNGVRPVLGVYIAAANPNITSTSTNTTASRSHGERSNGTENSAAPSGSNSNNGRRGQGDKDTHLLLIPLPP